MKVRCRSKRSVNVAPSTSAGEERGKLCSFLQAREGLEFRLRGYPNVESRRQIQFSDTSSECVEIHTSLHSDRRRSEPNAGAVLRTNSIP